MSWTWMILVHPFHFRIFCDYPISLLPFGNATFGGDFSRLYLMQLDITKSHSISTKVLSPQTRAAPHLKTEGSSWCCQIIS